MTDDELIARLRSACFLAFDDGTNDYGSAPAAADRIEALVKEMGASEHLARMRKAFIEEARDERDRAEARAERLEAAMVQMRDDRTGFRHAVHFRRFISTVLEGGAA